MSACSAATEDKVANAAPPDRIECATSGVTSFSIACAIERGNGNEIVLRHADGGFRRIDLAPDGTVTVTDGSDEPVGQQLPDGRFELTLGTDRYILPSRR